MPTHLVALPEHVLQARRGELAAVHEAINERFGTTGATDDYVNVFYAASDMAVMANAGTDLPAGDRVLLRQLWEALLNAT